jgi:hypothetical protein
VILALDPGSEETAMVWMVDGRLIYFAKMPNADLCAAMSNYTLATVVCEMVACYGMPVGAEIFDTCVWIGEYRAKAKSMGLSWNTITRTEVKRRMCGRTAGVNDAVIRQRLIDLYGPGREKAVGTKKKQGPLYGVSGDVWAALAVATAWKLA